MRIQKRKVWLLWNVLIGTGILNSIPFNNMLYVFPDRERWDWRTADNPPNHPLIFSVLSAELYSNQTSNSCYEQVLICIFVKAASLLSHNVFKDLRACMTPTLFFFFPVRLQSTNGNQQTPISTATVSMVHSVPELMVSSEVSHMMEIPGILAQLGTYTSLSLCYKTVLCFPAVLFFLFWNVIRFYVTNT